MKEKDKKCHNMVTRVLCNQCGEVVWEATTDKGPWKKGTPHITVQATWTDDNVLATNDNSFEICKPCYDSVVSKFKLPLVTIK